MASQALHPPGTVRRRAPKQAARAAAVAAVKGKYADVRTSSSQFAAAKRAAIGREQ